MNEQNRVRVERITARYRKRVLVGCTETDADAAFLRAFDRVRADVLRPAMEDVAAAVGAAGHDFRIATGTAEREPSIDLQFVLAGRTGSKDLIRFFARKDPTRGWQVIAELELKRSPFELSRFEDLDQMTPEVVERVVVDAVEQMFSSSG
jgi:hypothetical protein